MSVKIITCKISDMFSLNKDTETVLVFIKDEKVKEKQSSLLV